MTQGKTERIDGNKDRARRWIQRYGWTNGQLDACTQLDEETDQDPGIDLDYGTELVTDRELTCKGTELDKMTDLETHERDLAAGTQLDKSTEVIPETGPPSGTELTK